MNGALRAQAARWPGGRAGVADALAWVDAPHRAGISDALVDPERAAGQPTAGKPASGRGGMPSRPTPPAARRLQPAAGYRAGRAPQQQPQPPPAQQQQQQQQQAWEAPAQPAQQQQVGAPGQPGGPNLDLRSFRDYLLQPKPKAFSAREASPAFTPLENPASRASREAQGSAEVMSSLGQLYARLTALENSESTLQRTVAQQDQEIRAARSEAQSVAKQTQVMVQLEERLRRAEAAEAAATHRLKSVEEQLGAGSALARERQSAVDNELKNIQHALAAANQQMSDAAGQRRELHTDVEAVNDKLAERVERYAVALNDQIHRANEERLKLESSTKGLLHEVSTAVTDKMRNLEHQMLPSLDRKMVEAVGGVQRKLDDGLAKLATALREVDQLRNQGDANVRKDVGAVQELVQKGLLQLKAEAEKQKAAVTTLVKAEIQNRLLNMDGLGSRLEAQRLEIAAEHEAGMQQLAEVRAGLTEQVGLVANEVREAKAEAENTRETIIAEVAALRSEYAASDHGMMMEWRQMMGREHTKMSDRIAKLEVALKQESTTRQQSVREVIGSVIETKDALESAVSEWRDAMDAAETRWDQSLGASVEKLEAADAELQAKMREEVEVLEKEQRRTHSELDMKLTRVSANLEGQISANSETIGELGVRMEAVEQLLAEQASALEKGLEKGLENTAAKVLALQEETAETLFGFREHLDNELNSINDEAEKQQEETAASIQKNRAELKEEMLEQLTLQVTETEERMLSAQNEATSALQEQMVEAGQLVAEAIEARALATTEHVEGVATDLKDTMMSLRIRTTAAEERAMRVNSETQAAVVELSANLEGLTTQVAMGSEVAQVRSRVEAAETELEEVKSHQSRHHSRLAEMQDGTGQDDAESEPRYDIHPELLAEITELVDTRVEPWEDKLSQYEQAQRASATRLHERIQRANGRCGTCEVAIGRLEEDAQRVHEQLDAASERADGQDDRMDAQDSRMQEHEARTDDAEGRIGTLEGRADEGDSRIGVLEEAKVAIEERLDSAEGRLTALEEQDGMTAEALGVLDSRTGKLEEEIVDVRTAVDTADTERVIVAEEVEAVRVRVDAIDEYRQTASEAADAVLGRVDRLEEASEQAQARMEGVDQTHHELEAKLDAVATDMGEQLDTISRLGEQLEQTIEQMSGAERETKATLTELTDKIAQNGQEDMVHFDMLQKQCTTNKDELAALQDTLDAYVTQESLTVQLEDFQTAGQEQAGQLITTVTDAMASKDEMEAADRKISDMAAKMQRHETSLEEAAELGAKVRGIQSQVNQLETKLQEDAAMHQRRFDAQTQATRELIDRKRRESSAKLDRRNSERRQSEAEDRRNADLYSS